MSPFALLAKLNGILAAVGGFLRCPFLLVVRVYWGWQFMQTGWGKLHHLERTTSFFASLGIPAPKLNAIMASCTELSCGTLLALGLLARFASPALICVMCVAYATADREALLSIFSNPDKFVSADPFLFLFAAVIVLVFGPGRLALDTLVFREKRA
jgi:putative oxidoreductase